MNTWQRSAVAVTAFAAVLLVASRAPSQELPIEPLILAQSQCVWKTSDIIDPRIDFASVAGDVHSRGAQYSLMRKMAAGPPTSNDASAMIGAIKSGALAGILLTPRRAVSQRGQRMRPPRGWWQLLPSGQISTCLKEPPGEPPMIIYRQKLSEGQVDHAISTAWAQCGLPTPVPPCDYVVDRHKPQVECKDDADCFLRGLGASCVDGKCVECVTDQDCEALQLGKPCEKNLCGPPVPSPGDGLGGPSLEKCSGKGQCNLLAGPIFWKTQCPETGECLKRFGQECGVCKVAKHIECIELAEKTKFDERKRCKDTEIGEIKECVDASRRCAGVDLPPKPFNPKDCLEAFARCAAANPKVKGDRCRRDAAEKFRREVKRCESEK